MAFFLVLLLTLFMLQQFLEANCTYLLQYSFILLFLIQYLDCFLQHCFCLFLFYIILNVIFSIKSQNLFQIQPTFIIIISLCLLLFLVLFLFFMYYSFSFGLPSVTVESLQILRHLKVLVPLLSSLQNLIQLLRLRIFYYSFLPFFACIWHIFNWFHQLFLVVFVFIIFFIDFLCFCQQFDISFEVYLLFLVTYFSQKFRVNLNENY